MPRPRTIRSPDAPANGGAPAPTPDTAPADRPAAGGRRKRDSVRLVWDSKPKRPPSPRDIDFQIAEVVIPNPARDAGSLPYTFRDGVLGNEEIDRTKMNRLIWGDNLLAMQALLAQGYEGKIDLIYIDPPFDSKADYGHQMLLGDAAVTKEPSVVERLAYRDTWEAGLDSYLDMLYPRLQLMRRLLADTGSIYVHLDWHCIHAVRLLMDEVFGRERFCNEVIWYYSNKYGANSDTFDSFHNTLLLYSKTARFAYNELRVPVKTPRPQPLRRWNKELGKNEWQRDATGNYMYVESTDKELGDVWEIPVINPMAHERLGFNTQKPEQLLETVINASSRAGDLIADFFCGSATTSAVAERLGRRWLTTELGKVGIQVARSRLVQQDARPFLLENIGNYQREMIYLTGGRIHEMQRIILKLYGAAVHPAHRDLGSRRANGNGDAAIELVHVGYPDRPTSAKKAEELLRLAESLDGSGYKRLVILAWDYEYNFDAEMEARKKAAGQAGSKAARWPRVELSKRMIPPDVYDYLKKAKDEAEIEKLAEKIKFHEKPYLKLAAPKVGKPDKEGLIEVEVAIARYVVMDFPVADKEREKLREAVKDNFAILIDYWAIDWDYDGATFRSTWQALRGNGKRAKVVPTTADYRLKAGKQYTIAVRVVDVFGNDAAATCEVTA